MLAVRRGSLPLPVRLAKNFIRANQSHPTFEIGTILFQARGKSIDHSADHRGLLVWWKLRRRRCLGKV